MATTYILDEIRNVERVWHSPLEATDAVQMLGPVRATTRFLIVDWPTALKLPSNGLSGSMVVVLVLVSWHLQSEYDMPPRQRIVILKDRWLGSSRP
jgi:hypothetical protein